MSNKKHQLKLVTYPDPILTTPSKDIALPAAPDLQRVIQELIRVCRKHNGLGLAAPQVGLPIRIAIINLEEYKVPPFPLINPVITKYSSKKVKAEEGCLSIPGKFAIVERPEKVDVKTFNLEGEPMEFKADGLLARVIQHEVDHLNGILFIDHLSKADLKELMKDE